MGRAKANEITKKFDVAVNTINEVNVLYPEFKAGLIEKAKLLMTVNTFNWLFCSLTLLTIIGRRLGIITRLLQQNSLRR